MLFETKGIYFELVHIIIMCNVQIIRKKPKMTHYPATKTLLQFTQFLSFSCPLWPGPDTW